MTPPQESTLVKMRTELVKIEEIKISKILTCVKAGMNEIELLLETPSVPRLYPTPFTPPPFPNPNQFL